MKKKLKIISLSIVICLVCFSLPVSAAFSNYQYKILPGTQEWSQLSSLNEKIDACQIPDNVLKSINTKIDNSDMSHSGVITSLNGSNIIATSKWGDAGLYRHNIYDSPYSIATNYQYYK